MDKQTIVSNLKNKVEDEMSKAGVYSKGIDGMIAANDFKNSLGEEKNKKTDMIKRSIKQGVSDKLVGKTKVNKPVGKLTSSLPIMSKNGETDESTGSGSAGGFSAPLFSTTKKEMEENCWKGYKEIGGKKKNGKTVPNCVPIEEAKSEAWQRKEGKDPEGGLNAKGVASYRRANPGSKLQTAVTTEPSKLKPGSKKAKRRKSFCSRMKGMKSKLTSAKTARNPDSRINKSLRKWNCE